MVGEWWSARVSDAWRWLTAPGAAQRQQRQQGRHQAMLEVIRRAQRELGAVLHNGVLQIGLPVAGAADAGSVCPVGGCEGVGTEDLSSRILFPETLDDLRRHVDPAHWVMALSPSLEQAGASSLSGVLVLVADANHHDPLLQDRIRSVVHDICRVRSGPTRDILFVEADETTLRQASNVAHGVAAGPGSSVVLVDVGAERKTDSDLRDQLLRAVIDRLVHCIGRVKQLPGGEVLEWTLPPSWTEASLRAVEAEVLGKIKARWPQVMEGAEYERLTRAVSQALERYSDGVARNSRQRSVDMAALIAHQIAADRRDGVDRRYVAPLGLGHIRDVVEALAAHGVTRHVLLLPAGYLAPRADPIEASLENASTMTPMHLTIAELGQAVAADYQVVPGHGLGPHRSLDGLIVLIGEHGHHTPDAATRAVKSIWQPGDLHFVELPEPYLRSGQLDHHLRGIPGVQADADGGSVGMDDFELGLQVETVMGRVAGALRELIGQLVLEVGPEAASRHQTHAVATLEELRRQRDGLRTEYEKRFPQRKPGHQQIRALEKRLHGEELALEKLIDGTLHRRSDYMTRIILGRVQSDRSTGTSPRRAYVAVPGAAHLQRMAEVLQKSGHPYVLLCPRAVSHLIDVCR
jgi:hypothetical protein